MFSCLKSKMETPEQCVKSVQSSQYKQRKEVTDVFLVSLLLALNRFQFFFGVFTVNLEHTNAGWVIPGSLNIKSLYN